MSRLRRLLAWLLRLFRRMGLMGRELRALLEEMIALEKASAAAARVKAAQATNFGTKSFWLNKAASHEREAKKLADKLMDLFGIQASIRNGTSMIIGMMSAKSASALGSNSFWDVLDEMVDTLDSESDGLAGQELLASLEMYDEELCDKSSNQHQNNVTTIQPSQDIETNTDFTEDELIEINAINNDTR